MLDAIRSPLVFCNVRKDVESAIEKLVDNTILRFLFQILERVLKRFQHRGVESSQESGDRTWTTREPVSWQASEAHLPFKDLLTLPTSSV